jgi:GntR family transcriptional repressor for pyruvate dehydrogenase complex
MASDMRFKPVRTVRAYERIVQQVEEAVLCGELKPGDRLASERDLMAQFEVSRSTVREALRVLESGGLIRSRGGDPLGAEVLRFSPDTLSRCMTRLMHVDALRLGEVIQFRMVLDASSNLLAARLRTDEQLRVMEAALEAMAVRVDRDYKEFSQADAAFHDAVAMAAGNTLIQVCIEAVRGVVVELIANKIALSPDPTSLMQESLRHHEEVLEAVRARDGARAAQLSRKNLYAYYAQHLPEQDRGLLTALLDQDDLQF